MQSSCRVSSRDILRQRATVRYSTRSLSPSNAMSDAAKEPTLSDTMGMEQVIDHGETSGRAVIHYRVRPDHCHSGGIVQGGFVTGWIDQAMAHVVMARSNYEFSPLSLEIKISFLQ